MDLWRLTEHPTLDGEGGRLASARWHTAGSAIVYLAASPPGALIEVLVHLELEEDEVPPAYTLLRVNVPSKVKVHSVLVPTGEAWKSDLAITRKIGDAWLKSRRSALARVPSAILPDTFNYLLNPLHADAAHIAIAETHTAALDKRLLR